MALEAGMANVNEAKAAVIQFLVVANLSSAEVTGAIEIQLEWPFGRVRIAHTSMLTL